MKNYLKLFVLFSVLSVSSAAQALTTFDYSYTFAPGDTITGSFQGTLNSTTGLISGLTDIYCYINGIGLTGNGNLNNASYSTVTNQYTAGNAVVDIIGVQNNFVFINDPTFPTTKNYTNYFYITPWANNPGMTSATQFYSTSPVTTTLSNNYYGGGVNGNAGYYEYLYNGTYNASNWHVSATPIPAAAWLLGSGMLGLLGLKRRVGKV